MPIKSVIILAFLWACGDPIEREIARLVEGGEEAEDAKMELNLAKRAATAPLIAAFQNQTHPSRVRVDLAEALYRLYIREKDPRILTAMTDGLTDPETAVRAVVVRSLSDMGDQQVWPDLFAHLNIETDPQVQLEVLYALRLLGGWYIEDHGRVVVKGGRELTDEQRTQITDRMQAIHATATDSLLKLEAEEFVEMMAGLEVQEAEKIALKADLEGARQLYHKALSIKPNSKFARVRFGRFLYFNGEPQQGLERLEADSMVVRVPRVTETPQIDGRLDDPVWANAAHIDQFFQNVHLLRSVPSEGKTEAFLVATDSILYIAIKGHRLNGEELRAGVTQRDDRVWRDDSIEIFLDIDLDENSHYAVQSNSIGTIGDHYVHPDLPFARWTDWNGVEQLAPHVEDNYWSVEIELPFRIFKNASGAPGAVWGFNVTRLRMGAASEQMMWVPGFGYTGRPWFWGLLLFE